MTGARGARVDLVVVDVGPVQLSHTAGLIDGGASVQGATVVEEHKIARPERVAHLELVEPASRLNRRRAA